MHQIPWAMPLSPLSRQEGRCPADGETVRPTNAENRDPNERQGISILNQESAEAHFQAW